MREACSCVVLAYCIVTLGLLQFLSTSGALQLPYLVQLSLLIMFLTLEAEDLYVVHTVDLSSVTGDMKKTISVTVGGKMMF